MFDLIYVLRQSSIRFCKKSTILQYSEQMNILKQILNIFLESIHSPEYH